MIAKTEQKIRENQCRYQISDISDISSRSEKRDNPYLAEKKVILDYLRTLDNTKFHFGMLYQFVFFVIYNYSKKTRKTEKKWLHIGKKLEKMLISVISDIRYQEAK